MSQPHAGSGRDGSWSRRPIVLLVGGIVAWLVGTVLFFFPEPITTLVGMAAMALGVVVFVVGLVGIVRGRR